MGDLVIDPTNSNILYVGTDGGGVVFALGRGGGNGPPINGGGNGNPKLPDPPGDPDGN